MSASTRFRWLAGLLLISVVLIGVSQRLHLSPVGGILISCSPLIFYHLSILGRRKNGALAHSEIDSVYYFGFLITIVSLGFGVYFYQTGAKQDIPTLLRQFAVGIMATAYAVFARMDLTSRRSQAEVVDPQGLLDQQLLQSQDVLHHMMSVSIQAQALASSLSEARDQVVQRSAEEISSVLGKIASSFSEEISTSLARLQGMAGQVESTLSAINEVLVEQAMANNLQELSVATKALGTNTMTVASASLDAATAITMVGQEFKGVQGVFSAGREELNVINELSKTLRELDSSAAATSTAVNAAATELIRVTTDLRDVGDAVATAPRTMKRLADQVARTADGLNVLATVADRIDIAAGGLANVAGSTETLTSALDHLVRVAPQAAVELDHLQSGTADSVTAMKEFRTSVQSAGIAVHKFGEASGVIEKASTDVISLGTAANDVLRTFTTLSQQMLRSQEQLAAASGQLNEVTGVAALALQRDMEAATSSAAQVSKRLVELVNSIVEQTRRQQAVHV